MSTFTVFPRAKDSSSVHKIESIRLGRARGAHNLRDGYDFGESAISNHGGGAVLVSCYQLC